MDFEKVVKDYKIFIDISSLENKKLWILVNKIRPLLLKHRNKLVIAYKAYVLLQNIYRSHKNNVDLKRVKNLIDTIEKLKIENIATIIGTDADLNELNIFLKVFPNLRKKYNILFLTEDNNRKHEILSLNNSKNYSPIIVKTVSQFLFEFGSKSSKSLFSNNKNVSTVVKSVKIDKFKLTNKLTNIENRPLQVNHIPVEKEKIYYVNGKSVKILNKIGGGGEGTVYKLSDGKVCKIYSREKLTFRKYEKLKLMVNKKINYNGICWPLELIYNSKKEFVGYAMPKAEGKDIGKVIFKKELLEKYFPNWDKRNLIRLSIKILDMIKYLHDRNVLLGDINPFNILIKSDHTIYFVDTDSYQIEGFPCPVGTVSFTPPELQGKRYDQFLRTFGNEYFAVTVLLFMILMGGKHPYSKVGGTSIKENIRDGDFSYRLKNDYNYRAPLGRWKYIWSHLWYPVKEYFYNTFKRGGKYNDQNNRLSVDKWLNKLNNYLDKFDSIIDIDPESAKIFPNRFKKMNKDTKLIKCRICGKEEIESFSKYGVCRNCLKKVRETRTCIACGKEFTITNGEYFFYKEKNMNLPKRCKSCIKNKKYANYYNRDNNSEQYISNTKTFIERMIDFLSNFW